MIEREPPPEHAPAVRSVRARAARERTLIHALVPADQAPRDHNDAPTRRVLPAWGPER